LAAVVSDSENPDLARVLQELGERLPDRDATSGGPSRREPSVVVVLDGSRELRRRADVAELLGRGTAHRILWLCLDESADSLPSETRAHLELEPGGRPRAALQAGDTIVADIIPDLPTPGWADGLARSLAPLEDATPDVSEASLPTGVSFRSLHLGSQLRLDPADALSLARHWSTRGRPRTALLGQSGTGPYAIDVVADGPHALVGGTTGAGKSELLRSFIAALAVAHRPDELTFVLVDYKGGSAFQECARLPHTLGVVTDLDEHLGARALTSLGAELKRRERLLAGVGAKDLAEYQSGSDRPKLARLALVVDEFKMLADELPGFVDGLVRLAAVGRSLGVHLVLATQRPGGAISGDMRANIALRIALRVRDRADSLDLVDVPDAAAISDRSPGRAWLRTAGLDLTEVQTAYIGGPFDASRMEAGAEPTTWPVVWRDLAAEPPGRSASRCAVEGPTELAAVVEAARQAAELLEVEKIPSPWLPDLPDVLARAGLDAATLPAHLIPLGLVDRPAQQSQDLLSWDLDQGGHLGIVGGPRTGRTTSLLTLALAIAERHSPADVQLHALGGAPGSLRRLCALPHVGTVAGTDDLPRARRLVARLQRELAQRQADGRSRPVLVVLVDGWESLEDGFDAMDHGAPVDDLLRLLRDGLSVGIRFAVTGGRALTTGRLSSLLQQRLLLGMPDPLDLALAGVSPSDIPSRQGPGRAIDPRDGCEIQLACPGASPAEDELAIETVAAEAHRRYAALAPPAQPWRIEPLPQRVALKQIPPAAPYLLTIGVGGDGLEPLGFDPHLGQRHVLIVGPARSGRSTALLALASRLAERDVRLAVVTTRRSPLGALNGIRGVTLIQAEEADAFIRLRREVPDLAVLVDDADNLEGAPIEQALVETTRLVDSSGGLVAATADLHRASSAYRGLIPELARYGTGLILNARSSADGEVFRMRVDALVERQPGRGLLVADSIATPIQIGTDAALVKPGEVGPSEPARTP
jgi:S-DNA-T family DNA segregation ATPase FtsK/SpoIIIE